jgi:hypothetical protein
LRLVWSALRYPFISDANQKPLSYLLGYLFGITLLAIHGDLGPIALCHKHNQWPLRNPLLCFASLYNSTSARKAFYLYEPARHISL